MKWILIAWLHFNFGHSDTQEFTQFDTQDECLRAGAGALGKTVGAGDLSRWEYAYICAPGGVK